MTTESPRSRGLPFTSTADQLKVYQGSIGLKPSTPAYSYFHVSKHDDISLIVKQLLRAQTIAFDWWDA